ncbi:MAG: hypothetical protein ACMUIE_06270 [Thermoplasmatota archaeon]
MRKREPAMPLLVKEVIGSTREDIRAEDEDNTRTKFITITGARAYRALISGILMEMTDIGNEGSPIFKVRVADPTGGISFTIGRFDPEVMSMLPSVEVTYPVVVIGRITSFVSKRGDEVVTLKPELIRRISKDEREMYNFISARDSMARLWKLQGRGPLPGKWMEVPRPDDPRGGEEIVEGAKEMIRETLRFLDKSTFAEEMEKWKSGISSGDSSVRSLTDPLEEYEGMVIDIINDLDSGDGARWDDLIDHVDRNRLSRDIVEEVVSQLLDKGMIYEPVLGFLKAI